MVKLGLGAAAGAEVPYAPALLSVIRPEIGLYLAAVSRVEAAM
jgi:hypothetical protein